jgi:hypothetical protein
MMNSAVFAALLQFVAALIGLFAAIVAASGGR